MEQAITQNASFTLLRSYYEAYEKMTDEAKLQYIGAIMAYGFDGTEPTFTDPMADLAFTLIRPTLENSVQYHAIKRECGAKGGRPKKNTAEKNQTETKRKPNKNQNETKINRECDSESEYESDCDNDNDSYSESFAADAARSAPGAQGMGEENVSLADFERLWRAYPNKGNRQDALREYFNIDLPSGQLIPMIKAQRELYEQKKNLIVPNLATWLARGMYVHKSCVLANKQIQNAGA